MSVSVFTRTGQEPARCAQNAAVPWLFRLERCGAGEEPPQSLISLARISPARA
jgi:hypothetical protein